MRIPGVKTARLTARRLRSRLQGGGIILGYHRIGDSSWDPFRLCVRPEYFAEQLEVLQHHAKPLALPDLVDAVRGGRRLQKGVALTFDDGYTECLTTVEPLLEQQRLPAAVFVVTGSMGKEFWWDRLARFFAPPRKLPERLRLTIPGDDERTWTSERLDGAAGRTSVVWDLYRRLSGMTVDLRQLLLSEIGRSVGVSDDEDLQYRSMTGQELVDLTAGGWMQPGAHSHTHVDLSRLPVADQRIEIELSKAALEKVTGQPARVFSYPHGSSNGDTSSLVQQSGFEYACGSTPDAVFPTSDRFDLPRIWVPDINGRDFLKWLRSWIGRGFND